MAKVSARDRDIVTKSFRLLTGGVAPTQILEILDWDKYFNVFSSAMGDNRYFNPIAQWDPATDPRYGRLMVSEEGSFGGMYKDIFENNVTTVTITPCTAQFAGVLAFVTNMFSPTAAIIANKGRAPGPAFYMGQALGSIAFWPMQLISISTQFIAFLAESPRHQFWTAKPAMGAFTMAATGVLNDLMVKSGYIDPILPKRTQEQTDPLHGLKPDYNAANSVASLNKLAPDTFNSDGTFDLMRFLGKGARKHRVLLNRLAEMDNDPNIQTVDQKLNRARQILEEVTFDQGVISGDPSQDFIEKEMSTVGKYRGDDEGLYVEQDSAYLNQKAYENINNAETGLGGIGNSLGQGGGTPAGGGNAGMDTANQYTQPPTSTNPNETQGRPGLDPGANPNVAGGQQIYYEDNPNNRTWMGDIFDLVNTAVHGGMDAITLRCEGGSGPVTDSFSSSSAPSPLADKFNSLVRSANDFRFDVAGGNIGNVLIDGIINTIKEGAIGALSGTVIGNIPLALAGNAYVKIPNHWAESSASLHRESYQFNFRCNYAHPFEIITKIFVPFSILVTMVAGFTTGGSTYTTPFYHRVFCKSRQIMRTAMCEGMQFTFGEGPAGWTRDRKPLNLSVSATWVDLEPLVTIPIDRSIGIMDLTNPAAVANTILNDDSPWTNMASRIGGLDYLDTVLKYARLNRQISQAILGVEQSFRADNIAAKLNDSVIGDLSRLFIRPLAR